MAWGGRPLVRDEDYRGTCCEPLTVRTCSLPAHFSVGLVWVLGVKPRDLVTLASLELVELRRFRAGPSRARPPGDDEPTDPSDHNQRDQNGDYRDGRRNASFHGFPPCNLDSPETTAVGPAVTVTMPSRVTFGGSSLMSR